MIVIVDIIDDSMSTGIEESIIQERKSCQQDDEDYRPNEATRNLLNDQHANDDGEQHDSIINEVIFHCLNIDYLNKCLNDAGMGEVNSIGS
jgi:hypothetical protein